MASEPGAREAVLRDSRHGPLPTLILALTFVSGLTDAASFTGLGHVFVSNMTGNVVILGLALGDLAKFSLPASVAAILAFAAGALASGWLRDRFNANRGLHLAVTVGAECLLLAVALVASRLVDPAHWRGYLAFTIPAALAFGAQNATAARMGISGLSSTVLTTTIGSLAANSPIGGGGGSGTSLGRQAAAIGSMLLGAATGALLLRRVELTAVLALALAVLTVTAAVAYVLGRSAPPWTAP